MRENRGFAATAIPTASWRTANKRRIANESVEIDSEFAIKRKDFDIAHGGMSNAMIKDEVPINLKLA